jgi:DNA (cytosine-5)-methyltransferase 1
MRHNASTPKFIMNHVDTPQINILGLCAGVGQLETGVSLALECFGFRAKTVGFCERDSFASSVLLARMEEQAMEPAPIWCGDIAEFDAKPFRGLVDGLIAGLPCQPYSLAGKRQGNTDRRSFGEDGEGPLPHTLRIIEECAPSLVCFENVPAWVRSGWFRQFGDELCRLGYEIEEPVFLAAADVGASHERERVFVLAHRPGGRFRELWQSSRRHGFVERGGEELGNSASDDQRDRQREAGRQEQVGGSSSDLANPRDRRWPSDCGTVTGGKEPFCVTGGQGTAMDAPGIFAPSRNSSEWGAILDRWPHLAPAIEPGLRMLAPGLALPLDASRTDQLRAIGNGVVPLQAAVAFTFLLNRFEITNEAY